MIGFLEYVEKTNNTIEHQNTFSNTGKLISLTWPQFSLQVT